MIITFNLQANGSCIRLVDLSILYISQSFPYRAGNVQTASHLQLRTTSAAGIIDW